MVNGRRDVCVLDPRMVGNGRAGHDDSIRAKDFPGKFLGVRPQASIEIRSVLVRLGGTLRGSLSAPNKD